MSKFIGKGGYGKVYRPPPVDCQNTNKLKPPKTLYIGKMANTASTPPDKIIKVQKARREIDKDSLFTTPYLGACRRDSSNYKAKQWQNGKFDIQYVYPYAGKPLYEMPLKTVVDKWKFFCCLFKLSYQIAKMNRQGFYHFDIKADNILYQEDKCRLTLIDFDLSMPLDKVFTEFYNKKSFKDVIYYVWPPEINLGLNPSKQPPLTLKFVPPSLKFMIDSKYFTKEELLAHLNRFLLSKDFSDIWNEKHIDLSKIDLFSVGMLMKCFIYGFNKDVDNLINTAIEPIPSKRTTWPRFIKEYKQIIMKYFS